MKYLLLHSLAMSGRLWDPLVAKLDGDTVAMDARGHGDAPWDGDPFTIEDLAEDAAALIEERADGPVAVAGMSMGGCVAIALAGRRPELVNRLVLADTTANYGPNRVQAWSERADNAVTKPREEQLSFQIDRWFTPEFAERHPDEVRRVCDLFLATDSQAHAQACRALGAFDGLDLLPRITAATLVVVGEQDYATPPDMARTLAEGIPDAQLRIIPRARHFSLFEAAGELDVVAAHLSGER